MEELLVYAILFSEAIVVTEDLYQKKLDLLFLESPDSEILLNLEWETDSRKAMINIRTHFDYHNLNRELFGAVLMKILKEYYDDCLNIKIFADRMYSLWETLPNNIPDEEPFRTLSFADDPLSWGDEKQARSLYENMLNYYKK